MLTGTPDMAVLLGTAQGNALRAKLENFLTTRSAGKQFVGVDGDDALLEPAVIPANAKEIAALAAEGRLLVFPIEEVPELANGGKGVMAIKLHEGEKMVGIRIADGGVRIAAIGRGDKRVTLEVGNKDLAHYRGNRARTGRKIEQYHKRVEGFEPA
jgi:topoisomerase-4 subunit A